MALDSEAMSTQNTEVMGAANDASQLDEDEIVDPQDAKREECRETKACLPYKELLSTCTERVTSSSETSETCEEELFDFMHCVDGCVAKTLFKALR